MLFPLLLGSFAPPIDRHALVTRHNVVVRRFDSRSPLQVGNGEFAFGMDLTGMQTFTPFNTMSQWGWASSPIPSGERIEEFEGQVWDTHGRPVRYPMPDPKRPALSNWMSSNPHRINLGRIGLILKKSDGSVVGAEDLENPNQSLDLWSGVVTSRFTFEGMPVQIKTAAHPTSDTVAFQIISPLIKVGRLSVFFACPGDNPRYFANAVGDWTNPVKLEVTTPCDNVADLTGVGHRIQVRWEGSAQLSQERSKPRKVSLIRADFGAEDKWADVTDIVASGLSGNQLHVRVDPRFPDPLPGVGKRFRVTYSVGGVAQTLEGSETQDVIITDKSEDNRVILAPSTESNSLTFSCNFAPKASLTKSLGSHAIFSASRQSWPTFWKTGGAIDLSSSKDSRWRELERRIVLSQYLMKVNEAGSLPPQESGLVNNGWYGRFHMEMVWWHGTHYALWKRWPDLERYLGIYRTLLPKAKELASSQGYAGARWPKCIGPDGREWPDPIHALLIWQQPHPIFFAELDYRAHPSRKTLEKWAPLVESTADFLASYAAENKATGKFDLGPPIYVVSENTDPKATRNPAFELGYWRFGLRIAQEWRTRLGQARKPAWDKVITRLAPLPEQDGLYVLHEGVTDMWTKWNFEHPALIGTFGMLPGDGVDREKAPATLTKVAQTWNFNRTWGWDFPLLAMCAARVGQPDLAIDFLLHPSQGFQFDDKGLATGGPFPYFPSNGGLLYAVAMMAAGWDGAPKHNAPGFPRSGQWVVRFENLARAP